MVSHHFFEEESPPERVPEIVWSYRNRRARAGGGAEIPPSDSPNGRVSYLLVVATIEPRKNHLAVVEAWQRLRTDGFPNLNLVLVGALGWDHEATVERLVPWLERGGLHLLENVPAEDLRLLYRHAAATVCPSYAEGFDFSGIEAMCCGGIVVSSDIPVHREIYADASVYFNPYDRIELSAALRSVLGNDGLELGRRKELVAAGRRVAGRYHSEAIARRWHAFLRRATASSGESEFTSQTSEGPAPT
jgi:glycosyltransferase involved in cell wall biosynthesis